MIFVVTAGADTETTPQTQIVYDPIYDHKDGVASGNAGPGHQQHE
jgi:hypothetical protein